MKNSIKYFKRTFLSFLVIIASYFIVSLILSLFLVNKNFQESSEPNFEVWIKSNGVHLDIVLPINKYINWNEVLSVPDNIKDKVNYAGFGWGEKEFYINTPEWSDLKFSTAFKALFLKTDAAMHVTFYKNLTENDKSIKLLVNKLQIDDIQSFILKSFKTADNNVMLIENVEYGNYDRFYEANYSYSLFYTCNTWTNEALKYSGLPACVWTPFDKGILFQYRNYKQK